jgi:hypothetical protein
MQCQFCKANFTNKDAYQIHLGIGAPAFHDCLDESEMKAKGMQLKDGVWRIDESLIIIRDNWAYLKRDLGPHLTLTHK